MCRLIMFNKKGFDLIEERIGAKKLFDILEKSNGGVGNGIAYLGTRRDITPIIQKGVKYTNENIYEDIIAFNKQDPMKWCIYHTRIASMGSVTDDNCHPFESGRITLAMNGTERGFGVIANALNITDTEAVLRCVERLGINYANLLPDLSSNFLGFDSGVAFATSPNSDWKSYDCVNHEGAIIISSELPAEFDDIVGRPACERAFYWNETMELELKKKPKKKAYVYTNQAVPWSEQNSFEKEKQEKWRQQIIDAEASEDSGVDYSGKILEDDEKQRMMEIINREKERQQRQNDNLDYHLL